MVARIRRPALLSIVAMVAALMFAATPPDADAGGLGISSSRGSLKIDQMFDFVLDEPNEQAFFSEGLPSDSVLVTDLTGTKTKRISDLLDATGMALSPDGATLWVALPTTHKVARVDTTTLEVVEKISLPSTICPGTLTETAGFLVVGHGCDTFAGSTGASGVGKLDLTDETTWTDIRGASGRPLVVSSPGNVGYAVVGHMSVSPTSFHTINVLTGETLASQTNGSNLRDLAINPAGDEVVQASGSPYRHDAWRVSDLEKVGFYESDNYPNAVAWSADGTVVATGSDSHYGIDVRVHKAGNSKIIIPHETGWDLVPRGLAVSSDGKWIFAISEDNDRHRFHVLAGLGWPRCENKRPTLVGSSGDDVLKGAGGDDVVLARGGNDEIITGNGNDIICAGGGDDLIKPGVGDDIIKGGSGTDEVYFSGSGANVSADLTLGTATGHGVDTLTSIENLTGGSGRDTLLGDDDANVIKGRGGDDTIEGRAGPDTIGGGGDDDTLDGGAGRDDISGNSGHDLVIGGTGSDDLSGNGGDDVVAGEQGDDTMRGGSGVDTVSFAFSTNGVNVSFLTDLATGEGSDSLASFEWIVGTEHADVLIGDSKQNLIESRGGNDRLEGKGGDDLLHSGIGTDTILGGTGYDICIAGEIVSSCEEESAQDPASAHNDLTGTPWADFLPTIRPE